jgi:hypothetical protein
MKDLLEKLRKADSKTWSTIWIVTNTDFRSPDGAPLLDDIMNDFIQGEVQRACRRKGWHIQQGFGGESLYKWAYIFLAGKPEILGEGDSPAEAILKAYLAACEAQK